MEGWKDGTSKKKGSTKNESIPHFSDGTFFLDDEMKQTTHDSPIHESPSLRDEKARFLVISVFAIWNRQSLGYHVMRSWTLMRKFGWLPMDFGTHKSVDRAIGFGRFATPFWLT